MGGARVHRALRPGVAAAPRERARAALVLAWGIVLTAWPAVWSQLVPDCSPCAHVVFLWPLLLGYVDVFACDETSADDDAAAEGPHGVVHIDPGTAMSTLLGLAGMVGCATNASADQRYSTPAFRMVVVALLAYVLLVVPSCTFAGSTFATHVVASTQRATLSCVAALLVTAVLYKGDVLRCAPTRDEPASAAAPAPRGRKATTKTVRFAAS